MQEEALLERTNGKCYEFTHFNEQEEDFIKHTNVKVSFVYIFRSTCTTLCNIKHTPLNTMHTPLNAIERRHDERLVSALEC